MYDLTEAPAPPHTQDQQGVLNVTHQDMNPNAASPLRSPMRTLVQVGAFVGLCAIVAISAVVVKAAVGRNGLGSLAGVSTGKDSRVALASTTVVETNTPKIDPIDPNAEAPIALAEVHDPLVVPPEPVKLVAPIRVDTTKYAPSTDIRYFNGRAVRPARTIRMTVTAYSPDEKSCGPNACGITSSLHNVKTNGMRMVAADSRVLPLGSMISVPGYDQSNVVPVLDRGGAIKGNRLDVLFPTDAAARKWGVKKLDVVVWEYADNLPADDYRAIRDSKR